MFSTSRLLGLALLCTVLTTPSCGIFGHDHDDLRPGQLSHDVYFRLVDPTPEDVNGLVEACLSLNRIAGIVELSAGTREESLAREVNQTDFHVALHVVFVDKAAHDAYQDDPIHTGFVEAWGEKFANVRVFDWVLGGEGDGDDDD